jgi:cytochrome c biogenesis protein CcmG, thiol:disulfide interchange protein DsbE
MQRRFLTTLAILPIAAALSAAWAVSAVSAQTAARDQLARGRALWDQRLSKSAIAALEAASRDRATAAEAHEMLGRIYTFKGWQQEAVFPGWHDEPSCRERALAELKAAVAADPARASAQDALRVAEGFAAAEKVDAAPPRDEVKALDAKLDSYHASTSAPVSEVVAAIEARAKAQADPTPFFTGAQILIDRGEFDQAIALADRGVKASDRFIDENLSAYQMTGKSQGAYDRGRAVAADLVGWALFQKKDYAGAAAKLEESARLSQNQDFVNQFHLGELARAQNAPDRARDYYVNALSLAGGPAPLRQRATQALAALAPGGSGASFDAWLDAALAKRRDERKEAALKSLVDRPLPELTLTTVDGRPYDASNLRGKVVLLDFFASWCGVCRAELPQLKTAYAKYQNDPNVAFLLVSIDEDSKRLKRYLNEMKFAFPVARANAAEVEQKMGFDNVPATFYVDRGGVVRYQIVGVESHGDSQTRVSWFIDRLKAGGQGPPE